MALFAKAAKKSVDEKKSAKPSKNTTWVVGGTDESNAVAAAVKTLCELSAQEKALKAKKNLAATIVLKTAKTNHVRDFCELGVSPDTPMKVQNNDGNSVTFIVQDRSGQYEAKPEQLAVMGQLLGEDAVEDLTYTDVSLGLNGAVLSIPGVSEVVEKALERVVMKLVKEKLLTGDQADELITAKSKTAFKPGTLERAAMLCGRDTVKMGAFLDAMATSCTRYIKT